MPKIDMRAYMEAESNRSSGSDFQRMTAGGYVVRIIDVRTTWHDSYGNIIDGAEREYVKLIYDIAEGDLAGKFSDPYWDGEDRDWAHWICLSWKNLGSLKGMAADFDESNPGFDFMAAFNADKWDMFKGKLIGIVVGEEEYERNGEVKTRLRLPNTRSVDVIRTGKFRVPALKKLPGSSTQAASGSADAYSDDVEIPFL